MPFLPSSGLPQCVVRAAQTFSPDGRWVVTGSLDSTLRVWDLPSAHMIDWCRVPSVCAVGAQTLHPVARASL